MKYIKLFISPCFLQGLWIKSFSWALIFDVNHHVHHLDPKLQVKSLCTNHVFSAFHDSPIGLFCNSILMWCVRCIFLSLDSTFMKKIVKLFASKFSFVVKFQGFDLHVGLIFHQGLVCLELIKHLSFCFQKVNMNFFRKVPIKVTKYVLPHEIWSLSVHTHRHAQALKVWKP